MKATELMIGDWCQSEDLTMPAKYTGYFKKYSPLKGEPYIRLEFLYDGGHEGADIPESRIEPIPLTAEILEKNNKYFSKSRLMGEQQHYTYYLGPSLSLLAIYDADFSFQIGNSARKIKYVHELQHILRLCGLSEKADNFKV